MSQRPRILDELGAELDRAARSDAAAAVSSTGGRRRRAWWRTPLLATAALLGAGGVAAAGTGLLGEGDPLPKPRAADIAAGASPDPATGVLSRAPVDDPAGAPVWEIRSSRTAEGDQCTAVGQVVGGRFGIVGLDRVFRPLPVGAGDVCTRPPSRAEVTAGARVFVGRDAEQARTVVAGVAGPAVRGITVAWRGGRRTAVLGRTRTFVIALAGYPEDLRPALLVDRGAQAPRRIAFADTGRDEVADVAGGVPWAIAAGPARGTGSPRGLSCAQVTRPGYTADGGPGPGPLTPSVCGVPSRDGAYVAMRRFVPQARIENGTSWGVHPARTLVYGAVSADVVGLEVRGAGGPRRPMIFRPGGGYLVALDGRVDPRRLQLVVRMRSGRTLRMRGSRRLLDKRGRALREPAVPPWRSPASQIAKVRRGFAVPLAETIRVGVPVTDPAGGPAWVVRAWQARLAESQRYSGPKPGLFACFQVGPRLGGIVRRPTATAPGPPLDLGADGDGSCNDDKRPDRIAAEVVAYAPGFGDYVPGLRRITVQGMVPGATRVELLGAGSPRTLALAGRGGFLALLPGNTRGPLRLRATFADGQVLEEALRGGDLRAGRNVVDARTSDPDGAAPWGIRVGERPGLGRCIGHGRIVAGRFASISPVDGSVRFGEMGSACGISFNSLTRGRPIAWHVQADGTRQASAPTVGQVQRRTLAGRTVVAGILHPEVVELELRTPRDVRTLRPSGPGRAFIAVYDGTFSGGEIVMTARFRDGETTTMTQRAAPWW